MSDRAIAIIETIASASITYPWLRATFKADNGLKESLHSGHAVIDSPDQLDQYLYTYGPMIESQWHNVAALLNSVGQPTVLIDYGCGQGLAGLLMNDLTEGRVFALLQTIVLIEPSAVALARAEALYRRIAPTALVTCIAKRFDDVAESDLPAAHPGETLHVFSNALDVLGFEPVELLAKTLRPGRNTILSLSHDRDFNGGTPQIETVKAAIEGLSGSPDVQIHRSPVERFTCDNGARSKGLVWLCELEIEDG